MSILSSVWSVGFLLRMLAGRLVSLFVCVVFPVAKCLILDDNVSYNINSVAPLPLCVPPLPSCFMKSVSKTLLLCYTFPQIDEKVSVLFSSPLHLTYVYENDTLNGIGLFFVIGAN